MKFPPSLKFTTKLIISSGLLVSLVILITAVSIISRYSVRMMGMQVELQEKKLENLAYFIDVQMDNIWSLIHQLHKRQSVSELIEHDRDPDQIRQEMDNIVSSNIYIIDLLVWSLDKNFYHVNRTKDSRLTMSAFYSIEEDILVNEIIKRNTGLDIYTDQGIDRYISFPEHYYFTVGGNLYSPGVFPRKEVVGGYLLHLKVDSTIKMEINRNINNTEGTFFFDQDGWELSLSEIPYHSRQIDVIRFRRGKNVIHKPEEIITVFSLSYPQIYILNSVSKKTLNRFISGTLTKIILIVLVIWILSILLDYGLYRRLTKKVRHLESCMNSVQKGHLHIRYPSPKENSNDMDHLGFVFNQMCSDLQAYIDRYYKAEIEARNAEILQLQSQINPHFLYNTLENISMHAVAQGDEDTAEMIALLGKLFRWSIAEKSPYVYLEKEIDFLEDYLHLQSFRIGCRFSYEIQCPDCLNDKKIPKLILQPLVENAIKHNPLSGSFELSIHIVVRQDRDSLLLSVRNNTASGTAAEKMVRGIGLENIRKRLKLIYNDKADLIYRDRPDSVNVLIRLPLEEEG